MKKTIVIFALACFTAAFAVPFEVIEDGMGQEFYLIPLNRQIRDTTWDIAKQQGGGTRVTLGHEGVLAGKGGHELTGGGFVSKQFHPSGPTTAGGSVGYHHIPTDTNLKAIVAHTPQYGTDVGLQASRRLWGDKNTKLEAYGGASQHFGGPFGNSRPEANAGLQFSHGHNWFSG